MWRAGLDVCFVAVATFGASLAMADGPALTLAAGGRPCAAIVLPSGRHAEEDRAVIETEQNAARRLQEHVRLMSGALLPIVCESDLGRVEVADGRVRPEKAPPGATAFLLVGEGDVSRRLGVTAGDDLGPGGIRVRVLPNAVVLVGKDDGAPGRRGVSYAASHFLEVLGCRFLWPGESGKVMPAKAVVEAAPMDLSYSPPVRQRHIRMMPAGPRHLDAGLAALGFTREDWESSRAKALAGAPYGAWAEWQCLGGDIGIRGGHSGAGLRGGWKEHGEKHPDWFARQADGTRDQEQAGDRWRLCVSNPGLREHVAKDIIEQARQAPGLTSVSLSPNDGGYSSFCMCEACKALDPPDAPKVNVMIFAKVGRPERKTIEYPSLSDRYVNYWNVIAERVTAERPNLLFVVDAYSVYSHAPVREKLHPNLVVRYVPSRTDAWTGWQKAGARRIYWRPNNLHAGHADGALNHVFGRDLAQTMRLFADQGMLATDIQGIYDSWSTMGINYYVAARMCWNPRLTYDGILEDYCRAGFGPAAEPVRRYFLRAEELNGVLAEKFTAEAVADLRKLLAAASKDAGDDAGVRRRVAFLRVGLEYTALTAEAYRLADAAREAPRADTAAGVKMLDRRWLLMRDILKGWPLAVNVGLVAGSDAHVWRPLRWSGPGESTRRGASSASPEEAWLHEDQTPAPR
jgi:hypothetical protein